MAQCAMYEERRAAHAASCMPTADNTCMCVSDMTLVCCCHQRVWCCPHSAAAACACSLHMPTRDCHPTSPPRSATSLSASIMYHSAAISQCKQTPLHLTPLQATNALLLSQLHLAPT